MHNAGSSRRTTPWHVMRLDRHVRVGSQWAEVERVATYPVAVAVSCHEHPLDLLAQRLTIEILQCEDRLPVCKSLRDLPIAIQEFQNSSSLVGAAHPALLRAVVITCSARDFQVGAADGQCKPWHRLLSGKDLGHSTTSSTTHS